VRVLKPVVTALAALAGVVLVLELAFRLGGMWMGGAPRPAADGRTVVLCVGDSHTRGRPDPGNYPAQLERILNERADRPYRVVNLGVPGMNTAQVRERFERYLAYYRPAIVVHWAGINNFWNHARREEARAPLARLADASRLVRVARVALFYRRLGRETIDAPRIQGNGLIGKDAYVHVNFGGLEENIRGQPGDHLPRTEVEKLTRDDLTAMLRTAREHRIPMFLVAYGYFFGGYYAPVNQAIREVSDAFGVPWVNAGKGVAGAHAEAPGAKLFDTWVHPMPVLYKHIAEQAYETLVGAGAVRPRT
jgi:lysophospholipase L1-like esterase